ncbi:Phosphatidylinositol 5-phosphate 4-kinase type-2 beta, partial [Hymenolepis weldensis]
MDEEGDKLAECRYVVNVHGQTLLPQYLGMYRITVNDQETYLLAMRNVFSPRVTIHRKYDLKVADEAPDSAICTRHAHNFDESVVEERYRKVSAQ